jgi:hypothetical protein
VSRSILAATVAILTAAVVASGVLAQEATPSAGAAECTVEPFDLTAVLVPSEGTPVAAATAEPTPPERPTGEPADEEIGAAVTETIEQFVGCVNGGFEVRYLFFFSPGYLQRTVVGLTADEIVQLNEFAASETSANPLPENERTIISAIEDIEVLDDGRVVATVIGDDLARPGGPSPVYFVFLEVEGRYLIDEVIDPVPDGTPPAA